jgi:nucleoside-triphosphatase
MASSNLVTIRSISPNPASVEAQMELFSPAFIGSFNRLLDQLVPLVATVHARQHPVTDAIKQRPDIELLEINPGHADELLARLTSRLSR